MTDERDPAEMLRAARARSISVRWGHGPSGQVLTQVLRRDGTWAVYAVDQEGVRRLVVGARDEVPE